MKKKFNLITIFGFFLILSWAPTHASSDVIKTARTVNTEVDTAAKSLRFLTVNNILKDPELIKKAWEAFLEGLSDSKKALIKYEQLPTNSDAQTIVDKARTKIKNLQTAIAAFFKNIYDSVKKDTTTLDNKRSLVSAYEQLTEEWVKNPLGTKNADYEKLTQELGEIVKSGTLQANSGKPDEKLEEKIGAEVPTHSLDNPEIISQRMHLLVKNAKELLNQLTESAILSNEESAKIVWIRLMSSLNDAQKEQKNYTKTTETTHSKKIFDETIAMRIDIINSIENLFKDIEKQIVLKTGVLRHTLLSIYETWTTQWIESGFGQADFKDKTEKFLKQFNIESEAPPMPSLTHEKSTIEPPPPY